MDQQLFEKLLGGFMGMNVNNTEKENKTPSGEDMLRQLVSGFMSSNNSTKEENKKSPLDGLNLFKNIVAPQQQPQPPAETTDSQCNNLLNNMASEEKRVEPQYTWHIHYPNMDETQDQEEDDEEEEDNETEKVVDEEQEDDDEFVKLLRETTRKGREQKKEKLRKAIEETKERMMEVARKGVNSTTIDLSGEEEWIMSEIEDYFSDLGISSVLYDNRLSLDWSE